MAVPPLPARDYRFSKLGPHLRPLGAPASLRGALHPCSGSRCWAAGSLQEVARDIVLVTLDLTQCSRVNEGKTSFSSNMNIMSSKLLHFLRCLTGFIRYRPLFIFYLRAKCHWGWYKTTTRCICVEYNNCQNIQTVSTFLSVLCFRGIIQRRQRVLQMTEVRLPKYGSFFKTSGHPGCMGKWSKSEREERKFYTVTYTASHVTIRPVQATAFQSPSGD